MNMFSVPLATHCSSKKLSEIEKAYKKYMLKLENWLTLWRLSINPSKCQFIVFSLDKSLTFYKAINEIKAKCQKRINLLKIISSKSWGLTESTLVRIYYSIVRSIIDYAAIIFPLLCETNKKVLRSIQYHCLRISCRKPLKYSH
jgi:hypothetical protein